MNTEKFFEGPGASTMQTYVGEIALILLGAFILGYLLRLMLNSRYKMRIENLENEIEQLKSRKPEIVEVAATASAPFDTSEYDAKIRDQRKEIDKLNLRLSEYQQAKISAQTSLDALKLEMDELKSKTSIDLNPDIDTTLGTISTEISTPQININTPEVEASASSIEEKSTLEKVIDNVKEDIASAKEEAGSIIEVGKDKVNIESADISTTSNVTKRDDLKKIEGIGPKIESLLNEAGIYSYEDLKAANPEYIREVLVAAGPNYAVHDPATWSEQATLANNGNWDALAKLQEVLKGGKRK